MICTTRAAGCYYVRVVEVRFYSTCTFSGKKVGTLSEDVLLADILKTLPGSDMDMILSRYVITVVFKFSQRHRHNAIQWKLYTSKSSFIMVVSSIQRCPLQRNIQNFLCQLFHCTVKPPIKDTLDHHDSVLSPS